MLSVAGQLLEYSFSWWLVDFFVRIFFLIKGDVSFWIICSFAPDHMLILLPPPELNVPLHNNHLLTTLLKLPSLQTFISSLTIVHLPWSLPPFWCFYYQTLSVHLFSVKQKIHFPQHVVVNHWFDPIMDKT